MKRVTPGAHATRSKIQSSEHEPNELGRSFFGAGAWPERPVPSGSAARGATCVQRPIKSNRLGLRRCSEIQAEAARR
eukprot:s2984_g6.t1